MEAKKKVKMLNDYEIDSMWMSYRYCIGRRTIAAYHRAGDIASHCYGRMSDDRSEFTAFDINREIESHLNFGRPSFNIPVNGSNRLHKYGTGIDLVGDFMFEEINIKNRNDLYGIDTVRFDVVNGEVNPSFYEIKKIEDENKLKLWNEYWISSLEDLMIWSELAHLFSKKTHHLLKLVDDSTCYAFKTYRSYGNTMDGDINWKKVWIPVDKSITALGKYSIPEENIKEDLGKRNE